MQPMEALSFQATPAGDITPVLVGDIVRVVAGILIFVFALVDVFLYSGAFDPVTTTFCAFSRFVITFEL